MRAGDDRSSGLFAGPGAVRELARRIDWSATTLGPVDSWPHALRTIVRTCLDCPFPINLWCGPELLLVYNDAYADVLGRKHPEAFGRPGPEAWVEIWEQIAPMFASIPAGGPPIYAEDAPFVVERSTAGQEAPDAPNAWFTFALSAVRDDRGRIVAFLNIVTDTTDRVRAERAREGALARTERAEARLLEVFAHAPAFLAVLRVRDLIFEYVNAAHYQLTGHRELLGRPVFDALPEVRGQGFESLLEGVLATGVPYVGREVPIELARTPGAAPEQRYIDFVYYPITEADGTPSGVVSHGYDVTDHVLARREAHRARAEAEEANLAKSQFLANISHEIRTPINAIIGYTELLELGLSGPVTDAQSEQLARIRLSGQHLLGLIEDILDLTKAETGHVHVAHELASAHGTVRAAVGLVAPQAARREISLVVPDLPDEPDGTTYMGDEDRVRQVLVNLLSNAVKFTPPGGTVTVTTGTVDTAQLPDLPIASEHSTFFRVRDTGIGIAPEQLEDIFQPFMQVEAGHTRTRGGTGLGLTISRHLARLMGGELTAESTPGMGSTFTLWLPTERVSQPLPQSILDAAAAERRAGLAVVGAGLQQSMPRILQRFTERLRRDPSVPQARSLDRSNVENHAASLLADISQGVASLEHGGMDIAEYLRDGTEIQQVISKLHGAQRARLSWTEGAIRREYVVLREEIERAIRETVPDQVAELGEALRIVGRFLQHSERVSIQSWREIMSELEG